MSKRRLLDDTVSRLASALGDRLVSVVLYGPAAHGDDYTVGDLNLMIVLRDLEAATLDLAADPVRRWLGKKQPWPRLFSPETIAASADVFPIEFLDIARHRQVLHGPDPLADLRVETTHLQLQCERELREKLMRLREGYIECSGRDRALRELLAAAYPSFAFVFRGCLHLLGKPVPTSDREVVATVCGALALDAPVFAAVAELAESGSSSIPTETLYSRYQAQLANAVSQIDRFTAEVQGDP